MKKMLVMGGALSLILVCALVVAAQQDKSKRPSPPAQASWDLGGGKAVTVDYSSPRTKGRKIYGELVPFGQVWRTGANEATTLVTPVDLTIGGTAVPAGSYTIFTVPNKDKWALVISKKTGEWGTDYPGEKEDLARIDMKVASGPAMENFTISLDKGAKGCTLKMAWDTTVASVDVSSM